MNRYLTAVALVVALMCASASWGAIGVYKWAPNSPTPASVPVGISYMLNADANDTTDGWSVKIEIVPYAGGTPVRTYKFLYGDPVTGHLCTKGMHTNAVVWDGTKDDSTYAPSGEYKAVITAKRLPVTGTNIVPLWETTDPVYGNPPAPLGGGWRGADVVTDPNSPFYGYVYAARASGGQDVVRFEPDGSNPTVLYDGNDDGTNWGYSGPFGVQISSDGYVYASSFSKGWYHRWNLDGSGWVKGTSASGQLYAMPRFFTMEGPSVGGKTVATYQLPPPPLQPASAARIEMTSNDPTDGPGWAPHNLWSVVDQDGKLPYLMKPGIGPDGYIHVPSYYGTDPSQGGSATDWQRGGRLMKWNFTTTAQSQVQDQNWKIRRGVSVAFTQDGQYAYISRYVESDPNSNHYDPDQTAVYKIPFSALYTTADPDNNIDCEKYGFLCTPAEKTALMIETDALGNLVSTGGRTGWMANGRCIGLYAPPDPPGSPYSIDSRSTTKITWSAGEYQPKYDGSNSPLNGSNCDPNAVVTITVQASDLNGYLDIWRDAGHPNAGCFLDRTPFGQSVVPMNPVSGNGSTATYSLAITVPSTVATGTYQLPVYVRDRDYPTVPETVGYVTINVAGAWISGTVTNSVTGWPVEDATVEAIGTKTFTAKTDANGVYVIAVDPGTYLVNAHKPGANPSYPRYADSTEPPTMVTVGCNDTATDVNRTLDPLIVWNATGGNARNNPDQRPIGEVVCVRGIVFRAARDVAGGVANGLNGYYYIYDTKHANTPAGCKVRVYTGQATLKEGDEVVVEGTWVKPGTGRAQGEIVPIRPPYLVASGKPLPTPLQMSYYTDTNNAFGRLMKYSSQVVESQPSSNRFRLLITRSPSDSTPWNLWVYADTPTTTGITIPEVGTLVEILGINCVMTDWGENVLVCGKPNDVYVVPTVTSLGAARALPNGGVIIDASANPLVVTYVDKGDAADGYYWFYVESPDRTAGIKVNVKKSGLNPGYMPEGLEPGYKITNMRGNLALPTSPTPAGQLDIPRELQLNAMPSVVPGEPVNIPAFLSMTTKAFGGGGYPPTVQGVGVNTEGLLVRLTGTARGYGSDENWEWFYLDDGSGVPNEGGYTGVKVFRSRRLRTEWDPYPFPTVDGQFVTVQGISTSRFISGVGRIRMLYMRWDPMVPEVQDAVQIHF
jgi:hypothetical protein